VASRAENKTEASPANKTGAVELSDDQRQKLTSFIGSMVTWRTLSLLNFRS